MTLERRPTPLTFCRRKIRGPGGERGQASIGTARGKKEGDEAFRGHAIRQVAIETDHKIQEDIQPSIRAEDETPIE
jgi:hypothetical protein